MGMATQSTERSSRVDGLGCAAGTGSEQVARCREMMLLDGNVVVVKPERSGEAKELSDLAHTAGFL